MRMLPLTLTALCATAGLAAAPSSAWADDSDPQGNNGTVKIDGAPFDDSHGNEPHVGCTFHLNFWGFDAGQTAAITFTGQAPTKLGTLLTQEEVPISGDAAGGGKDQDAVLSYTAQQLGLTDQPAAKQGWHVKVAVDVDDAPGGAKQKVFWLSCASAAPKTQPTTTSTTTSGGGSTTTETTETTGTAGTASTTSTPARTTEPARDSGTAATRVRGGGSGDATSTGPLSPTYGSGSLSGAGAGAGTAGAGSVRGQAVGGSLPLTGDQTANLLMIGAGAVAAGTALTLVARRRRTAV